MGFKIQTIKDIRTYLTAELAGIYDEHELRAVTNLIIRTDPGLTDRSQVYLPDRQVSQMQAEKIARICAELKTGKPLQYIIGGTDFYGLRIMLNRSVLIPRPETEELVDLIVRENRSYAGQIIDFGTGSGCIAIALAVSLPLSEVTATDISSGALELASENAKLNNCKITFIREDMHDIEASKCRKAGIIVSNPPYVRNSEKDTMNRNVLDFEPHIALFVDDSDPLLHYRAVIRKAESLLTGGGKVYFEINEAFGEQMAELLESAGYTDVSIVRDINGKNRFAKGLKDERK